MSGLILSALLLSSVAAGQAPPVGLWHAELIPSTGHEVFFDLRVVAKGSGLSASLLNGTSEIPFTSAVWDGATLTLELAHYDAKVVAQPNGGELEGRYTRVVATGLAEVPFRASRKAPAAPTSKSGSSMDGSWGVEMGDGRSIESPAIFPLEGWVGYPTTLFLDRRHRIVKTHSGFDGPATGERFAKLRSETQGAVEMLLRTTS